MSAISTPPSTVKFENSCLNPISGIHVQILIESSTSISILEETLPFLRIPCSHGIFWQWNNTYLRKVRIFEWKRNVWIEFENPQVNFKAERIYWEFDFWTEFEYHREFSEGDLNRIWISSGMRLFSTSFVGLRLAPRRKSIGGFIQSYRKNLNGFLWPKTVGKIEISIINMVEAADGLIRADQISWAAYAYQHVYQGRIAAYADGSPLSALSVGVSSSDTSCALPVTPGVTCHYHR